MQKKAIAFLPNIKAISEPLSKAVKQVNKNRRQIPIRGEADIHAS
jgi:hypothetical protein